MLYKQTRGRFAAMGHLGTRLHGLEKTTTSLTVAVLPAKAKSFTGRSEFLN